MADAATVIRDIKLQVAAARQEESGNGFARLPRSALSALGVTEGDVIEIEGKRATAARVMAAYPEDEGLEVIRLDWLQRGNAEAGSGDHVQVRKAESKPASRVVFAPAQREMRLQGPGQALKRNFFGRALVAGLGAGAAVRLAAQGADLAMLQGVAQRLGPFDPAIEGVRQHVHGAAGQGRDQRSVGARALGGRAGRA